ncbi:MAG: NAD(P)/FAD-dependent oxidoreductase [Paracoccaceae bacterium]
MTSKAVDVAIIGAGVTGAAVAFWLTKCGVRRIALIERDPTLRTASTSLSAASIRQQFGTAINIRISQFSLSVIRNFGDWIGEPEIDLGLREHGYLICAPTGRGNALSATVALQRAEGAETMLLSPDEIADRFPYVRVDDLAGASWGASGEGWFDGIGLRDGFMRAARRAGAELVAGEVAGLETEGGRVTAVTLSDGARLACGAAVNAAGAPAAAIARMAGIDLPVEPRKRHVFVISCAEPIPAPMPLVTDATGVWVRPEGHRFLCGAASDPDRPAAPDDFETDHARFEGFVWPALAARIPQFERVRVEAFWTGHYAWNRLDQNAIIGPHPDCENLFFANGFSGHGLQQAPAVGRGIAEWITEGRPISLDLTPLGWHRVLEDRPLVENAVI